MGHDHEFTSITRHLRAFAGGACNHCDGNFDGFALRAAKKPLDQQCHQFTVRDADREERQWRQQSFSPTVKLALPAAGLLSRRGVTPVRVDPTRRQLVEIHLQVGVPHGRESVALVFATLGLSPSKFP